MKFVPKVSHLLSVLICLKCSLTQMSQWTFLGFFFVFEVGSLICGVAQSSSTLIVGRVIAGLGTSGIMNGALLIISEIAPMHKRPSIKRSFVVIICTMLTVL